MATNLDPGAIMDIYMICLAPEDGDIEVTNAIGPPGVRFDSTKLASHREEIKNMLLDLPSDFLESGGGGMSFLNACMDKDGNQWTSFHMVMNQLFALGLAIDFVMCPLPREYWPALPGAVPYYTVLDASKA